jgi:hypothetical protein
MTRWLYNMLAVREWSASQGEGNYYWWHPELEDTAEPLMKALEVGDFIGQGRRLQYCGLTHAILKATQPDTNGPDGHHNFPIIGEWDPNAPENITTAIITGRPLLPRALNNAPPGNMTTAIGGTTSPPHRPWQWYATMIVCLLVVWIEILMSFFFDFITPPVVSLKSSSLGPFLVRHLYHTHWRNSVTLFLP